MLCTAGNDDLCVIIVNTAVGLKALCYCFAQRNNARGGSVLGLTLTYGCNRRHTYIIWSFKIRFARAEADNIKSVGFHLLCKTVDSKSC